MGTSAGGLYALSAILSKIPRDYPLPIIVVQHRSREQNTLLEEILQGKTLLAVKQAEEKQNIRPGTIYFAPPDYHLLIEKDETLSLSADEEVQYSRPSINVLFDSAAETYGESLAAIILTGANYDGAAGIASVKDHGGLTIAQDPGEALFSAMPSGAIATGKIDYIKKLSEIVELLTDLPDIK